MLLNTLQRYEKLIKFVVNKTCVDMKIKLGLILLTLLISVILYAQDPNIKLPQINTSEISKIPLKVAAELIPLEDAADVVVGEIKQIKRVGDKLIILDTDDNADRVVNLFDMSGRHIRRIGVQGRAGEEYISVAAIGVDAKQGSVIFADGMQQKLISYTLSGEYMNSIAFKNAGYISDIYTDGGNLTMIFPIYGNSHSTLLGSLEVENNIYYDIVKSQWNFGDPWGAYHYAKCSYTTNGQNSYFIKPLCDTIFQYNHSERVIYPVFTVRGKSLSKSLYNYPDIVNMPTQLRMESGVQAIYLVKNILFVLTSDGSYIYDTESGRLYETSPTLRLKRESIITSDGESLYAVLSPLDLDDESNLVAMGISAEMIAKVKARSDDSNPVIIKWDIIMPQQQ